jgi:RNA polymerase sigma-70 factor, ECF subfamily
MLMSDEDAELIHQAKAGDPRAFSILYDRYQPQVYRYVYFRVNDIPTAEDLTSEVFVRLVENIGDYRDTGRPILAWLYTIARNLVIDHYRREARMPQAQVDENLSADGGDPARELHKSLERGQVVEAIERLTEDQRQVIVLKFFDEVDNATTATLLNKTVGAVKALQHRALATLARLLVTAEEEV